MFCHKPSMRQKKIVKCHYNLFLTGIGKSAIHLEFKQQTFKQLLAFAKIRIGFQQFIKIGNGLDQTFTQRCGRLPLENFFRTGDVRTALFGVVRGQGLEYQLGL